MKRMSYGPCAFILLIAVSLASVGAHAAGTDDGADGVGARVCGVRVAAATDDGVLPFNALEVGTTVAILVTDEAGGIVAFDEDASKIETFADDQSNDLFKGEARFQREGIAMGARSAKDGKWLLVEVFGSGLPSAGARAIRIKGVLVVKIAQSKKTFSQASVALKEGTELKAGPVSFKISKIGKPDWGDKLLQVTFETDGDVDAVAEVRFKDQSGRIIESSSAGTMTSTTDVSFFGFGGKKRKRVWRSYDLAEKVETATIEVTCWTDLKTRKVPLDLAVTVGLGAKR